MYTLKKTLELQTFSTHNIGNAQNKLYGDHGKNNTKNLKISLYFSSSFQNIWFFFFFFFIIIIITKDENSFVL